jgi:DNA-binding NarL/FixJ family response regulator
MNEIKIIIADDHPIFRGGLKNIIEKEPNILIVAEAETGARRCRKLKNTNPMSPCLIWICRNWTVSAWRASCKNCSLPTSVIILTMHKDEAHFNRAIDLGVSGFVVKDGAASEIVGCIKAVAANREYFSPAVSSHLLHRVRRASSFNIKPESTI